MRRLFSSVGVLLLAIFGGLYLRIRPSLNAAGVWRSVESIGNGNCQIIPELQACEKVILHQPTGLIYLACSTPHSRTQWTPALNRLNASGRSETDYVATYDPKTDTINRLQFSGHPSQSDISLHGMDVVASSEDPSVLYVYLVNHRKPEIGDPWKVGADSVIELFKTQIGSSTLEHVKTFQDPLTILTPNDVVGSPDGKSCHFTNDHRQKTGLRRRLGFLTQPSDTSVGFCHVDGGCKFAYTGLHASNGIVKGSNPGNDTFYVADFLLGDITVLERQFDNTLTFTEVIKTGRSSDNLAIDANGALWVAGLSDAFGMILRQPEDPSVAIASSALRITTNCGLGSFYGEKYNVDKVFEDSGELASGSTSAVYDSERRQLFMHGIMSAHLTVCML
ncbi:calcium-dependent phosphotriesterase [Gyrodon lividus]|nr:calcium-dependent phosphotriesterase [Gyrodon lividus]